LDNARADAQRPADLEDAITVGPEFSYSRFDRRLNLSPAELCAVLTCTRQPFQILRDSVAPAKVGDVDRDCPLVLHARIRKPPRFGRPAITNVRTILLPTLAFWLKPNN
jgi:hypothetical protein